MDSWLSVVDDFLNKLGFIQTAIMSRPVSSAFAELSRTDKVPVGKQGKAGYEKFLQSRLPPAFAVGERGGWGLAAGDYPLGKAIGNCQRSGQKCRLYAVDNDVVCQ